MKVMKFFWTVILIIFSAWSVFQFIDRGSKKAIAQTSFSEELDIKAKSHFIERIDYKGEDSPIYDPKGRRDPFRSPLFILKKDKKNIPLTPLQRYDISELKLTGVVWGGKVGYKAMILAPDGKGYSVGINSLIGKNGGRVINIGKDKIVIREKDIDLLGKVKKNNIEMKLREE